MSGPLLHSPANILRQVLVDLGLASYPPAAQWACSIDVEPDEPEDSITLYDTDGRDFGRTMPDGERQEMHGVLIRVRSGDGQEGYAKARAVAAALDSVRMQAVTVGSAAYLVWSVSRTTDVVLLVKETFVSKRNLRTLNCVVSVRMAA